MKQSAVDSWNAGKFFALGQKILDPLSNIPPAVRLVCMGGRMFAPHQQETDMQYMLLLYGNDDQGPQPGTPEFGAMMAGYQAFNDRLDADGITWSGEALQGVETATLITRKSGKVETMDGPFAETKEQLGGYYLIDVPDLDAALRYAQLIPAVDHGTIEVRPVMDVGPMLEQAT